MGRGLPGVCLHSNGLYALPLSLDAITAGGSALFMSPSFIVEQLVPGWWSCTPNRAARELGCWALVVPATSEQAAVDAYRLVVGKCVRQRKKEGK